MQAEQQTLGPLERRIDMSLSVADIEKDVQARLKRLSRTVRMAGFRPGKAPLNLIAQQYGPQVRGEAVAEAVEKVFGEQVREQKFRVAGRPRIEPRTSEAEESLEFSAVFEVYPEIALGDMSEKEVERPVLEVGDAEVDKTLEVLRKQRQTFAQVDRAAADADRVVINFTGRKDGEVFAGGQANDYPVIVGAGSMLPEFEAALRGMVAGESKVFDLTFPEDYHAKELAGQAVQFEVQVNKVEEPRLPELDEEFAKALGVADGDVAKLRDEVRSNLMREVKKRIQSRVKEQAMNAVLDANPIEVPKALVDAEAAELAEGARKDLQARGMDVRNVPVEPAWFMDQAVRRVKLGLIVAEIVKTHELYAKPEQVKAMVEEFAQSYEDPSEVVGWYYGQPQRLAQVEALVIEDNVVDWVLKSARATDKSVTFEELMGTAT